MAAELGRAPRKIEFQKCPETASSPTIEKYFGSWNAFLRESGVHCGIDYRQNIANIDLINQVQKLAEELGRTPMAKEYDMCEYTSTTITIRTRFGDWRSFIDAAGLPRNKTGGGKRVSEDELIRQVQQLAADLGRVPNMVQFDDCEYTSSSHAARNRFGLWSEFLKAAGMKSDNRGRKRINKGANDNAED